MPAEIALPVIIGAAVIDSINPCAFGVLIFFLAYMLKISKDKTRVLIDGIGYVIGVYLTYLFLGALVYLAISNFIESFRFITTPFYQAVGIIIILFGLIELKDFAFPGKGPSLQIMPRFAAKIKVWTASFGRTAKKNKFASLWLAIVLGFLVALVELPCTGAPYIAVIAILVQAGIPLVEALPLLMIYNIIFVLPLIGIITLVYKGMATKSLIAWKNSHKGFMRLAAGILLIALGIFIFFFDLLFGG